MRAKSTIHVEYEVCRAILESPELAVVIGQVKSRLVPMGDNVAEKKNIEQDSNELPQGKGKETK